VESEAANKEKVLTRELEECQSFVILRISKKLLLQDLRQAAFFDGVLLENYRYDMNKDNVDGKFISIEADEDENMENAEGQGDNLDRPPGEAEPSLEEL